MVKRLHSVPPISAPLRRITDTVQESGIDGVRPFTIPERRGLQLIRRDRYQSPHLVQNLNAVESDIVGVSVWAMKDKLDHAAAGVYLQDTDMEVLNSSTEFLWDIEISSTQVLRTLQFEDN